MFRRARMHTMYFFTGLCLGSICGSTFGLLLALLLAHSRAQSLAEEMTSLRSAAPRERPFALEKTVPAQAAPAQAVPAKTWASVSPDPWRHAHPSTATMHPSTATNGAAK